MTELIDKWYVVNKLIQLENNYQFYKEKWDADVLYRRICELEIGIGKMPGVTDIIVGDKSSPTGWIPVSERLPQGADGKSLCKNVIAYTIDGQVVPGWLNGAYWYLLLLDDTAFTRLERDCVTHWMPLPQPPKEEV